MRSTQRYHVNRRSTKMENTTAAWRTIQRAGGASHTHACVTVKVQCLRCIGELSEKVVKGRMSGIVRMMCPVVRCIISCPRDSERCAALIVRRFEERIDDYCRSNRGILV